MIVSALGTKGQLVVARHSLFAWFFPPFRLPLTPSNCPWVSKEVIGLFDPFFISILWQQQKYFVITAGHFYYLIFHVLQFF